jgi:RNase P protein component
LLDGGSSRFGRQQVREQQAQPAREAELFAQIGRLQMELAWVKKAVNRNRVRRLMRQRGIQAVMLRKRPATSTPGHRVYSQV